MAIRTISTVGMTDAEWVEARRGSIGGSDAAAILGLNAYSSPLAVWGDKTGKIPAEDISGKESVRLGHFLEPYVADRFAEITGKKVRRRNCIIKNDLYPWAHANVDRVVVGENAGLECKTTSELNLSKFRGGEYPANYYVQCMHYMAVCGFDKMYLAVLIGNREVRIFEIQRDDAEIAALMEAEERFWECVQNGTPPAIDGMSATADALDRLWPAKEAMVDLTSVCVDIRQYIALRAEIKKLEQQLQKSANAIKAAMQGATKGFYGDFSISWNPVKKSTFDKKAFQKGNPGIDLSKYSKTTEYRQFSIK